MEAATSDGAGAASSSTSSNVSSSSSAAASLSPAPSSSSSSDPHSASSLISTALELKASGTALVAQGDFSRAIAKYVKVFAYVKGLRLPSHSPAAALMALAGKGGAADDGCDEGQKATVNELLVSTNANLALCYSKLGDTDRVLYFASKALELQPSHVKALYRRGAAYRLKGNVDAAREDLTRAQALAPLDAAIRAELQRLRKDEQKGEERMRQQFKGMFA